jgi:Icc-related predicted phosphoesterase
VELVSGAERMTQVVCAADPGGSADAVDALLAATEGGDTQALVLVGNLGAPGDPQSLRTVFKSLARGRHQTYWVPGPDDAPVENYLREAANIEVVSPVLRGLHGAIAFAPGGHVVVAGFGGQVSDDPGAPREEAQRLSYPRWEPEYRLKVLHELDEHQFMLMFATPPQHESLGGDGSELIAELIGTHRPRLVVCGGAQGSGMIGRSLIVAPGSLRDGHYAVADLNSHAVRQETITVGTPAQ